MILVTDSRLGNSIASGDQALRSTSDICNSGGGAHYTFISPQHTAAAAAYILILVRSCAMLVSVAYGTHSCTGSFHSLVWSFSVLKAHA